MMFHINVKKHGLFKCHGWRCWKTNFEKLIKWNAWFAILCRARMWSWGWRTLTLLKNMLKNMKVVHDMPHLGKKEGEWYIDKKCNLVKNEVAYFQRSHITIVGQVIQGGLKREWGIIEAIICHYLSFVVTRTTYVGLWSFEAIILFFKCPHVA
jgi:hypothetical protein